VTPEDLQAIARKLTAKAKGGDLAAIKLVLLGTLGKPDEPLWPDTVDPSPAAAGDEAQKSEFRLSPKAPDTLPEASADYEVRKRAALRQLAPIMRAAKAAEALPADTHTPEAPDFP
jgi:hypothetical protein